MTTLEIFDRELDEAVATVTDGGDVDAETPLARDVLDDMLDDDGAVGWRSASAGEGGVVKELSRPVAPGERGYLYAVADALPYPLEAEGVEGLNMPADGDDRDAAEKLWSKLPARLKK